MLLPYKRYLRFSSWTMSRPCARLASAFCRSSVILDVRLPGRLTGLDLLTLFRQQAELSEIPVLIMTGGVLSDAEEASIARQRGFLFYKPEGFDTIVNFLDRLTGRDRSH
jgi:DNA-binding response OmpR family regulator